MAFTLEEQIQKNYLGLAVMFLVLTALTTALRFWSRKLRSLSFGLDDWLAMAALVRSSLFPSVERLLTHLSFSSGQKLESIFGVCRAADPNP